MTVIAPVELPTQIPVGPAASRAPRVLHVVPALAPGGMERGMVRLLSQSKESGHPISHGVCVLRWGDTDLLQRCRSAAPTWVLGRADEDPHKRKYGTWLKLRRVIQRFAPDIVHARSTGVWLDAVLATRGMRNVRLLLAFHGRTGQEPIGWRRRLLNRFTTSCADAVLSISQQAAHEMSDDWGVDHAKLHVIPDGVDTRLFSPDSDDGCRARIRGGLGIANDAHVAICVANLLPVKAIDVLLKAWRQILMADRSAQLLVVGDGPLQSELTALTHELRCESNVHFLGRREDVPALLRASDLFVLSSLYEGTSNAVQEAMASQLAVVATDVGGMCDLIESGRTGWLIPSGAAHAMAERVLFAFRNPAQRSQIARAARRAAVEDFSLERWIERYSGLYRQLTDHTTPQETEGLACAG